MSISCITSNLVVRSCKTNMAIKKNNNNNSILSRASNKHIRRRLLTGEVGELQ